MSQQEMGYREVYQGTPKPASVYDDEARTGESPSYGIGGQKLSGLASGLVPTAGQRLALAITSLGMIMGMTFGLILIAIATNVPPWAVFPILFMLTLFTVAAILINAFFNRRA